MSWRENVAFSRNRSSIWRRVWHTSRLKLSWSRRSLKAKNFHLLSVHCVLKTGLQQFNMTRDLWNVISCSDSFFSLKYMYSMTLMVLWVREVVMRCVDFRTCAVRTSKGDWCMSRCWQSQGKRGWISIMAHLPLTSRCNAWWISFMNTACNNSVWDYYMICLSSCDCCMHITLQISGIVQHLFTLFSSFLIYTFLLFPSVFLWSPYVIGQTIIFSSCFFLLSFFFLA